MKRIALAIAAVAALFALLPAAALAASAPTVTTGPVLDDTPTSAIASGTVNLNGSSLATLSTTTCYVEYGTSASSLTTDSSACDPSPAASGTTTVYTSLSGLTAGTTYYYAVVVVYNGGVLGAVPTNATGATQSFTTPTSTTLPSVSTSAPTSVGGSDATLNGSVNANNWSIQSCTFRYTISGGSAQSAPCGGSSEPAGASAQAVSASVSNLAEGNSYSYSLTVTYGTSASSQPVTSTTNGSFTTMAAAIAAPANLTSSGATLQGSVNPEGQTVTDCEFYYGTSLSSLTKVPCSVPASQITGTSPTLVTAAITGLKAKTLYAESVVITTAQGEAVAPIVAFTTPATPPAPTAQVTSASRVSSTTATLHANVDAGGEGVEGCEFVYSVTNPASASGANQGVAQKCDSTPSTTGTQSVSVTLKGLAPGTRYYYQVLFATYGGVVKSNVRSFTTPRTGAKPTLAITKAVVNARGHSASFRLARRGAVPVKGYECALATVTHNKVGRIRYANCGSAKTYTKLKPGRYEFLARARGAAGVGSPRAYRFTI